VKTDAPGSSPAGEPGVDELLGLLASEPLRAELAGRDAAAAMFRENFRAASPTGDRKALSRDRRLARRDRRALRRHVRRARLLVAVVVVLIIGGFAGAAYSAALPAPVQHIAYHVLGFAGVPDTHRGPPHRSAAPHPRHSQPAPPPSSSSAPATPVSTRPSGTPSGSPKPGKGKTSPSPSRRPKPFRPAPPSGPVHVTATAAHDKIAAGAAETFTASLTRPDGSGVRGGQLTLIEHDAGESGWREAGQATTGADGRAVLTVSGLTVSATFRVTGPDDVQSQPMRVIVVPQVSLTISAASHGTSVALVARSPLADPGDRIVLQVQSGGHWVSKRIRRLDQAGKTRFAVRAGREYRVVLLGTIAHGRSVSGPVQAPAR
jgi:hypothetical protein